MSCEREASAWFVHTYTHTHLLASSNAQAFSVRMIVVSIWPPICYAFVLGGYALACVRVSSEYCVLVL